MSFSSTRNYRKPSRALLLARTLLAGTAVFATRWFRSRAHRPFVWALPALVMLFAVGALLLMKLQQDPNALTSRYDALARSAVESQDLVSAQLYLEKALQTGGHNSTRLFHLGLVAERLGQTNQAVQIMRRLAPAYKQGYSRAHWWLARRAAIPRLSPAERRVVRHHLTIVLHAKPANFASSGPSGPEVLERLASLEMMDNDLQQASQYLLRAFRIDPRRGLALARLYVVMRKTEQARTTSISATRAFQDDLTHDPSDLSARRQLATLAAFRTDFTSGEQYLLDGLQTVDLTDAQRARLRVDLGVYRMGWARFLANSKPESVDEQLRLLNQTLALIPNNPQLFEYYGRLSAGQPATAVSVLRSMERLLRNGQESGLAHWVLGTILGRFQQFESAEHHLRLAAAKQPSQAAVYNNLAWVLTHQEPPQLTEALRLVQIALHQWPQHPGIRETRGQIYLRMGEFEKAAADLEYARDRVSRKTKVSQALVTAYTHLGMPEMAFGHQSLVDQAAAESGMKGPATETNRPLFTSLPARIDRDQQGRVVGLDLEGPEITDDHLDRLLELPHLSGLSLSQTAVTDAGLAYVHVLKQLHFADLRGTQVSPQGVADLQQSLPDCLILK